MYKYTTQQDIGKDILNKEFLITYFSSDNEDAIDITRLKKIKIFVTTFNTQEIFFGKGIGQFKGGTTLELTPFTSQYMWLLQGSCPMFFFLIVQVGIAGLLLYYLYWKVILLHTSKSRKYKYSTNILIYISLCFLLIQFYNDSLRQLFMCGIIMYLLVYASNPLSFDKKKHAVHRTE